VVEKAREAVREKVERPVGVAGEEKPSNAVLSVEAAVRCEEEGGRVR
jgi:hypothetical protein